MTQPLTQPAYHREAYGDRFEAEFSHDVDRFSTAGERYWARAFVNGVSYPCSRCSRFAFPTADVVCFWCRNGSRKL